MGTLTVLASVVAAGPSASAQQATGPSCPWVSSGAPIAQRVDQLLSKMTLADKVHELHGDNSAAYAGTVPAIPRLCIPALTLDDSPSGVGHGMTGVTQLPSAVSLASTWDTGLSKRYGDVIGSEQWGKGNEVDLGPTVNIVRDPRWGRAFETYGEDPYLAGQIGAGDVKGIQNTGEMAQLKHLAVYNQETNRNNSTDDAIIDQRVEQEMYLSQFDSVIKQADPASVMCSYSFINGTNACQDPYTLSQVLRDQWHYKGFVTSDWGGTHSTVPAAEAGLNMQMPDGGYYGAALEQAVSDGQVSTATIDKLVKPILTEMFRFHLFTDPPTGTPSSVVTTPAHQEVGQRVAEDGTVLLKNSGHVLPLSPTRKSSIAVIGDDAGTDAMTTGGGSAAVAADSVVTPYQGIASRAGKNVTVRYAQGNSSYGGLPVVPSNVLAPSSGSGSGLTAQYYRGTTASGTPIAHQDVPQVDFNWNGGSPAAGVPTSQWSAKYTGTITAPTTGSYTFSLTSDDGSRLSINGKQIIDNWRDQGGNTETGTVTLTAGEPVSIEVDYYQGGGGSLLHLGWQPPGGPGDLLQQAVQTAKSSDVAVVFASNFEGEGSDLPNIDLPADENKLISAVAAANPNTIVVLNTGSAVTMPWLDSVKGVFEAWYPGQNDGDAIASLLFGDVNPSGKLPVTFPKSLSDVPASTPAQWPGVGGKVQYSEGLNVGYRWYDAKNIDPLFAFGSGLSYTTFRFSHLRIGPQQTSSLGTVRAKVDVQNTGRRSGADVVQLYVGDPAKTGEPPAQLKRFEKVDLRPGQTKQISFTVPAKDFATWNDTTHNWQVADGTYRLMVGDSSTHLPERGTVRVTRSYGSQGVSLHAPTIVAPGTRSRVTATFTNDADVPVRQVAIAPHAPKGWTVTPSRATERVVAPHSKAKINFTLTPPASAKSGSYSLTADASFQEQRVGHGKVTQDHQTLQVPYSSWDKAYDNVGVSDDSDPGAADFDGSGDSYSAQRLAAAGITPGATVTSGKASFTWPKAAAGRPDNIATQNQVIAMSGSGSKLNLLGAGAPGNQSGDITITYTDGATSTAPVTLADWWANSPAAGDTLVTTTTWNQPPSGGQGPHDVSLYATSVPLTPGKTVAYVSLPDLPGLHLFAASVGR
ncbi:glycoside hydrolase family 3 C-terminal domain-containing protein [Streptomyces montanisoli]|uniref:Exo-alpha-(1->6)-L-arabinopyranosidase n=1 Tax=Streptomyces montanisoli TaxID=2798581 RepID=A0A940MBZ6_9ACTN|nr:glycoside hydrolase family 3 C-terminal domain-containing protein [Streptomyces montanisoli]MBP0457220.1 glycoside hydrolase family 3 C-terminal domain-containing protein [Streptomyces montanisoli]